MPRRGSARSGMSSAAPSRGFGSLSRPAPPAPRPAPTAPVPVAQPQTAMAQPMMQPKQPGMFAQMATTAAGVAVGSAVGHTIGHAMTSGGGGQAAPAEAAPAQAPQMQYQQQPYDPNQGPCAFEIKQFMDCAQNQGDITLCQGFNEAIRQCKQRYGMS